MLKWILIAFLLISSISLVHSDLFDYSDIIIGCSNEVCDGVDNDCDLRIDEDLTRSCLGPNPNPQLGNCTGQQSCFYGSWLKCDTTLSQQNNELCNNIDDDCDGAIDEGFIGKGDACGNCGIKNCNSAKNGLVCSNEGVCSSGEKQTTQCGTSNQGICKFGTKEKTCNASCQWSSWSSCVGNIEPSIETCDGLDNDCDGIIDNGCNCVNGTTRECGSNTGECTKGTQTCTNGKWPSTCSGEIKPIVETCDNKDNDCDGTIDNLSPLVCGTSNVGNCSFGISTCSSGVWSDCNSIEPLIETCDSLGLDEDCDNEFNEGCECTSGEDRNCGVDIGICRKGKQTCTSGKWSSCNGGVLANTEICGNTLDDDCDGIIDDGCVVENNNNPGPPQLDPEMNSPLGDSFNSFDEGFLNTSETEFNPEGESVSPQNNFKPKIVHSKYSGQTTNFDNISTTIPNLVLEVENVGKIIFNEPIFISRDVDLDAYTDISDNSVYIDSSNLPELNKKATITIYTTQIDSPIIIRDEKVCPPTICKILSISDDGKVEFVVEEFSSYSVMDADWYVCDSGEVIDACVCEGTIVETGYCCDNKQQTTNCDDGWEDINPTQIVDFCDDDIEGECVSINGVTGTCTDGNFIEGCKRRKNIGLVGELSIYFEKNPVIVIIGVVLVVVGVGAFIVIKYKNKTKDKRNNKKHKKELLKKQKEDDKLRKKLLKAEKKAIKENNKKRLKEKTKEEILEELKHFLKE